MAYEFKDSTGREWTISTTVAAARKVHDETGLSIYGLPQKKFQGLFDLVSDPFRLVEVAWVLCRGSHPELERDQFEAALDGPAVERMADAVMEAVPDFFSDAPGRENLRELIKRAKRAAQRMVERDRQRIQAFDPEKLNLDKLEKQILKQQQGEQPGISQPGSSSAVSGDGLGSAGSTPESTPSPS